jgi:hypothetical protein
MELCMCRPCGKSKARSDFHEISNQKQQSKTCKHTVCLAQSHPALLEEAKCLGWTCHGPPDMCRPQVSVCPHMTDEQLFLLCLEIHKSTHFTANKKIQFLFAVSTLPLCTTTASISITVNKPHNSYSYIEHKWLCTFTTNIETEQFPPPTS